MCDFCEGKKEISGEFHENHNEQTDYVSIVPAVIDENGKIIEKSYISVLVGTDCYDCHGAMANFDINFCPMCGKNLDT